MVKMQKPQVVTKGYFMDKIYRWRIVSMDIPMNSAFTGFFKIYISRWGPRATGNNINWCSTPGIKQKATSTACLYPTKGHMSRESWATKKQKQKQKSIDP
jgi:hypothetical protein